MTIESEDEYNKMLREAFQLLNLSELLEDQIRRLDEIMVAIEAYEDEHYPIGE